MTRVVCSTAMIAAVLALGLTGCGEDEKPYSGPALPYTPEAPKPKEDNPKVALQTSMGEIQLELFEDDAVNTVNNFVELAEKGFYNGLIFHRVIKEFMIQGGCPRGDGSGGPGYRIPDEVQRNPHKHSHYALSMAKESAPNTGGSQFFIVTNPQGTSHLDGQHTVFGKVTQGFDVVDKIAAVETVPPDKPKQEVRIMQIKVLSKRSHPYQVRRKIDAPEPPPIVLPPAASKGGDKAPEKKPETTAGDKKPDEKKVEDKKPDEKKPDDKKTGETKPEEKK